MLTADDSELRDLCRGTPPLVEALSGRVTGLNLISFVGAGGMSSVFRAELEPSTRSIDLSPTTPTLLAVKVLQPSTWRQFKRLNQDPANAFLREVVALSRVMERQPPTEFVVGYYGSGYVDIQLSGEVLRLPWLAIEYVDGGTAGASLAERVEHAQPEGIDPIRALRLIRGIFAGVAALHDEGIVHRDLKPENVLVAGPVDDETPKLVDCGIARVDGLAATIAAMTPSYGGPEQLLSSQGQSNPLIGPWTDIHALSAVAWYVLSGEDWCRSDSDPAWHTGQRRSLRTARATHSGILANTELLTKIDAVLARGAAARLPESVWAAEGASEYLWSAKKVLPSMWSGAERYMSVSEFAAELFPLLEQCATLWTARAGKENRAATAFRATQPLRLTDPASDEPRAVVAKVIAPSSDIPATPGSVVFQPDGRFLMRFGSRLDYFINDKAHRVTVPPAFEPEVAATRWMVRGPGGGFALVGPTSVLLIRGGRFAKVALPTRASGGEVGEISAIVDDGHVFGVVTDETDDSEGGPELWRSNDGNAWEEPISLPIGGEVRSIAYGPYGYLAVGARKNRARALFLGFDNHPLLFTKGVTDHTPLSACVCSAGRAAWGAGEGFVLYLERSDVHEEPVDVPDAPVVMGLDLAGTPWLVTEGHVLRRHLDSRAAKWRVYHRREVGAPPFVAIGFSSAGVRIVDAGGGGVQLTPRDIRSWQATVTAD